MFDNSLKVKADWWPDGKEGPAVQELQSLLRWSLDGWLLCLAG